MKKRLYIIFLILISAMYFIPSFTYAGGLLGSCGAHGERPMGWFGSKHCCKDLEYCSITGTCLYPSECQGLITTAGAAVGAIIFVLAIVGIIILIILAYIFIKRGNIAKGITLIVLGILTIWIMGIGLIFLIIGVILIICEKRKKRNKLKKLKLKKKLEERIEKEKIIICPNCNTENNYDAKYCNNCGKPLRKIK